MQGRIYYVGEFSYPEGEAASYRVLGNVQAMRAAGFEVVVVGRGPANPGSGSGENREVGRYHLVDEYGPRSAPKWRRAWRYIVGGSRLMSWLKAHAAADAQAIILAGGYSRYLFRLLPLCRSWRIPLFVDVVEWFEPSHCLGGRFGPQRWDVELSLRSLIPRAGHVIAISSFLERHFQKHGAKTLRVPPLIDATDSKWQQSATREKGRLRLGFAGNAGQKDLLVNAIRGLARLGNEATRCELRIVGPTRDELGNSLGSDAGLMQWLGPSLQFTGRLSHHDALAHLAQCDFSILLRPNLRFAHAGFPTKLVETLAIGVPPIGNLTSDMGIYLKDGDNALLVEDCSPDAFLSGLQRAIGMSDDMRAHLRSNARKRAELSFDYRHWAVPMGRFLNEVLDPNSSGQSQERRR